MTTSNTTVTATAKSALTASVELGKILKSKAGKAAKAPVLDQLRSIDSALMSAYAGRDEYHAAVAAQLKLLVKLKGSNHLQLSLIVGYANRGKFSGDQKSLRTWLAHAVPACSIDKRTNKVVIADKGSKVAKHVEYTRNGNACKWLTAQWFEVPVMTDDKTDTKPLSLADASKLAAELRDRQHAATIRAAVKFYRELDAAEQVDANIDVIAKHYDISANTIRDALAPPSKAVTAAA